MKRNAYCLFAKFLPGLSKSDGILSVGSSVELFQLRLVDELRREIDLHADDADVFRPRSASRGPIPIQQVITHCLFLLEEKRQIKKERKRVLLS
jgi:hypothetical protein